MASHSVDIISFTSIDDINALRAAGFVGAQLKRGLLRSTVFTFASSLGVGALSVRVRGDTAHVRLVCHTQVSMEEVEKIARTAVYTVFRASDFVFDLAKPMYSAEEVLCGTA